MEGTEESAQPFIAAARAFAERLALAVCTEPPVRVEDLITAQGIEIVRLELPATVSGQGDLDQREIYVNTRMHPHHQRFTLAHELGHFMLNHERRRWTEFVAEHTDQPLEREANAFAGGILMPAGLLRKYVGDLVPARVARLFEVSETALWVQLLAHRLV